MHMLSVANLAQRVCPSFDNVAAMAWLAAEWGNHHLCSTHYADWAAAEGAAQIQHRSSAYPAATEPVWFMRRDPYTGEEYWSAHPHSFGQPHWHFSDSAHCEVEQQQQQVDQRSHWFGPPSPDEFRRPELAGHMYEAHGQASQAPSCSRVLASAHDQGSQVECSQVECSQFRELLCVVVWNVAPSLNEETRSDEFFEVDFVPKELVKLKGCEGAFLLVFTELYEVGQVCIALDKTNADTGDGPVISDNGAAAIRLAQFNGPEHDEIPNAISASAKAFIPDRSKTHVAI